MQSTKTIDVVSDETLGNIIKINNIIFRGRQNIDWKMVEIYLQKYIGMVVELSDEIIYIDKKFVEEYTGSLYTRKLRGSMAKAKANAAQGIVEMLKFAILKKTMENKKESHKKNAKKGWKYYKTRFAIPIYNEQTKEITFNVYRATLIVRFAQNGKAYLYDMQEIKKETSNPPWTQGQVIQKS